MIKRKVPLKRKTELKKKSYKQKSNEFDLKRVYSHLDIDRERICTGCGCGINLSHSHIISRKDHELMCDCDNITYHCLPVEGSNGCSYKWEQVGLRAELLDYIHNMEYIKRVRYNLFKSMIIDDYAFINKNNKNTCLDKNYNYICKEFKKL